MNLKFIFFLIFSFLFILLAVFRNWFFTPDIIGGDWPYIFSERVEEVSFTFPSWNQMIANGLGGISPSNFLQPFQYGTFLIANFFHLPWVIVYKIFWFGLFVFLSFFSSLYLAKIVFRQLSFYYLFIAGLIYTTNTYVLMVVGGGQMGVALAYSVAPLVFSCYLKLIDVLINSSNKRDALKKSLFLGLSLSLQIMFDPRITYITAIAIGLHILVNCVFFRKYSSFKLVVGAAFFLFVLPGFIAVLLHASWIVPLLFTRSNPITPLGEAYTGIEMVRFLSFGTFSQTLSLLHPNWPENIFGKVSFMKPQFLIIPIIVYLSLLFLQKDKQQEKKKEVLSNNAITVKINILFFVLLGLIGAFLAKGTNGPSGEVYAFAFQNIPGFIMFRDSTKFFLLICLSYSVLSVYAFTCLINFLKSLIKQSYAVLFLSILFGGIYVFLLFPAFSGRLSGTFARHEVPKEYVVLNDFLHNQKDFSRSLWVPRQQRFTPVFDMHPSVEAEPLFGTRDSEKLTKKISSNNGKDLLSSYGIKYIMIPYDSLGELFLDDRKYNEKERKDLEGKLDAIPWLRKIGNGKIAMYETPFYKDHFFLSESGKISYTRESSDYYTVRFSIQKPQRLVFSENYSPYWTLTLSGEKTHSKKTAEGLNSFFIEKPGDYTAKVNYSLHTYFVYGRIISVVSFLIIAWALVKLYRQKLLT